MNGTYSEEKAQEVFNKVKEDLLGFGVQIISEQKSELKKLAYEITYLRKHYTNGYFCTIIFDITDSQISNVKKEIDKMFKYSEDVVRYLVIENDVYTKFNRDFSEEKEEGEDAEENEEVTEEEVKEEVKEEEVEKTETPEEVKEEKEVVPEMTDEQLDDKIEEALK
ncbi:MAG: 30S ribosomal protein S6 [Candidatus Pacebacteria bacterium]|nr:30S ribosomal protein S6 [Candidatus Paceibacterota bacterium]